MKRKILWGIGAVFALGVIVFIYLLDFPSWKQLDMEKLTSLSQTTVLYNADGKIAAGLHSGENRTAVEIEQVPEYVRNAFIAIEDARFYEHPGVDIWRIGGALLSNLRAGGYREGASTITQQLIKLTHLTSEKTLSRKAQEAWLALQLEKRVSKDEILEMYLNVVYFGRGAYGIEAAAQSYFDKSCSELTLSEGAMLAGIIKAPSSYAPHIDMNKAIERRDLVLDAMVREELISRETADEAKLEEIDVKVASQEYAGGWYIDQVLYEAESVLNCSAEELLSGGYRIYTSLREDMQQSAEELFRDETYFPAAAADGVKPEGALIALDPENGEIMCLIGGRSYETQRGLNRATQIKRQPGSAFKPISVYAAAIDFLGYTPMSLIQDEARDFGGGYMPSNASGKAYGTVTLRQALTRSMNLAAVDLITRTGIEAAKMYAQRAGIELTDSDSNLSLALGSLTEGVSPAQLCAAYAPLANGGYQVKPHTIRRVEDLYGRVLYEYEAENEYVMDEKSARMITDMLQDTATYGTAKKLTEVGFEVAAKTGTVGNAQGGNRDAWTVAYTPSVAVAVWQGFDIPDEQHMLPDGTTGGTYPAKLTAEFLKMTEKTSNGGEFSIPLGMSEVLIDSSALIEDRTAMLASENTPSEYLMSEILPDAQIPVLVSDRWNEPKRVDAVYVMTDEKSGYPAVSFVSPDSYAQYHILRAGRNGETTEVGIISGSAGSYLTFVDESCGPGTDAQYCVISRHAGFMKLGRVIESLPSETVEYRAPMLLERLLQRSQNQPEEQVDPLFGKTD